MIIQEESVAVTELPVSIAGGAQIIGIGGAVEALDTSEIEPQEVFRAVTAGQGPGRHDVVQCENFLEVQGTVAILIELPV